MRLRDTRGQAVVEYAIVFPIQLLVTLAIVQLAHIFVARHMVSYAAFCGARAALVAKSADLAGDAEQAAVIALSAVAGPSGADSEPRVLIPGWGELPRSGAARLKTEVDAQETASGGIPAVECEVRHLYELTIPIGNWITYQIGEMFALVPNAAQTWGEPHLLLTARTTLVKPWNSADEVGED